MSNRITYPATKKEEVVDLYFETEVPDPYRWLEDDVSEETASWVKAQNELTYSYLKDIPFRNDVRNRMTKIWNHAKMGLPVKEGECLIYSYNSGLLNQPVIFIKKGNEREGQIILDPNLLSEEGTVALSVLSISKDTKYLAYGLSRGGSDWLEVFVRVVDTGKDLDDHLQWIKFSGIAWYGEGFFYTRYAEPEQGEKLKGENKDAMVFYHRMGTPQSDDLLIQKDENHPDRGFNLEVTEDEQFVVLYATESTSGNALAVRNADAWTQPFTWLENEFHFDYQVIGNKDSLLYVLTNVDAPKYKLIGIDLNNPERERWTDVIPEHDSDVMESVTLAGDRFFIVYLHNAHHKAFVSKLDGEMLYQTALPGIGSLDGVNGKMKDNTVFYSYSSFNHPPSIFKFDVTENKSALFFSPNVDFDADSFETRQVFYSSKDGTIVPMFIVCKKGIKLNGSNPTLLYGYGGFNISCSPSFSTARAVWLEQGGIFALANIRGGGEYGENWHRSGTILQKQNVFDDFIAAAEYLIHKKYTSNKKLAIYGGSNGGLLIGAVINQRPDLFAAAIPMVGVLDMLRFHKFTIGRYWTIDYGSSDDPEQFTYLLGYSPLHNVGNLDYPAVLVTTGDHDDRVVPAHSFKYIATLQEKYKGEKPVLIRITTDAGHGAGKPTDKVIEEYADIWTFIYDSMKVHPQLKGK